MHRALSNVHWQHFLLFSYFASICLIFVVFVFLSKINAMSQVSFYLSPHPALLRYLSLPCPCPLSICHRWGGQERSVIATTQIRDVNGQVVH